MIQNNIIEKTVHLIKIFNEFSSSSVFQSINYIPSNVFLTEQNHLIVTIKNNTIISLHTYKLDDKGFLLKHLKTNKEREEGDTKITCK